VLPIKYYESESFFMARKKSDIGVLAVTRQRVITFTERLHGSGFNCDWSITSEKGGANGQGKIIASCCYEPIDDNGFYDDAVDFSVIFHRGGKMEDLNIIYGAESKKIRDEYDLEGFIDDMVFFALRG
jgi:hypothetical protein